MLMKLTPGCPCVICFNFLVRKVYFKGATRCRVCKAASQSGRCSTKKVCKIDLWWPRDSVLTFENYIHDSILLNILGTFLL